MMAGLTVEKYAEARNERLSMIDRIAAVVLAREPAPSEAHDEAPREPEPREVRTDGVARDLEALARCIPALEGSAAPIIRIPGGKGDGSPAEYVQPFLSAMRRALRKLAALRSSDYGAAMLLLAVYVYGGESTRTSSWVSSLYLALLPRDRRLPYLLASRGPDAASLTKAASSSLVAAERAYALAADAESDGRWLSSDLDAVSRAVRDLEAQRGEVEAARPKAAKVRKPAPPPVCAPALPLLTVLAWQLCAERARGGLVNARSLRGRAKGSRGRCVCRRRRVDRWIVRGAALVASERRGVRPFGCPKPSATFAALLDAPVAEGARPVRAVVWK